MILLLNLGLKPILLRLHQRVRLRAATRLCFFFYLHSLLLVDHDGVKLVHELKGLLVRAVIIVFKVICQFEFLFEIGRLRRCWSSMRIINSWAKEVVRFGLLVEI